MPRAARRLREGGVPAPELPPPPYDGDREGRVVLVRNGSEWVYHDAMQLLRCAEDVDPRLRFAWAGRPGLVLANVRRVPGPGSG